MSKSLTRRRMDGYQTKRFTNNHVDAETTTAFAPTGSVELALEDASSTLEEPPEVLQRLWRLKWIRFIQAYVDEATVCTNEDYNEVSVASAPLGAQFQVSSSSGKFPRAI